MLEVRGVGVQFGGLSALRDVSFAVPAGTVVSVIGPNGAGKTTLFSVITGFCPPSAGSVAFKGEIVTGLRPNRIARLGLVRTFQKTEVFPELSVLDCVRTGFLCRRQFSVLQILTAWRAVADFEAWTMTRAHELLQLVGLAAKARFQARQLSYGEQRLLEVAVGLAAEPELFLMDEPASGLNPEEAERMAALIGELRRRRLTVLLVEHNMAVVMGVSDRVVVLHHGEKIAEGTPAAVSDDPEVIRAYLGSGWAHAVG